MTTNIFITLSLLLSIATPAHAQDRDLFEGMGSPKRILRGAMLTDEQAAKLRVIRTAEWERERIAKKTIDQVWERFESGYVGDRPTDPTELKSLGEEVTKLQAQIESDKLETLLEIRAMLSRGQLAQMAETHQKAKALDAQLRALPPALASETR